MPGSSYNQSNFTGGEWSNYAQGQIADPRYDRALALCRNAYVTPEGSWQRRQGTQRLWNVTYWNDWIWTLLRGDGKPIWLCAGALPAGGIIAFTPGGYYNKETLEAGLAPSLSQTQIWPICDQWVPITNIAKDDGNGSYKFSTGVSINWGTYDSVVFTSRGPAHAVDYAWEIRNFIFQVIIIDNRHFTIADPFTGRPMGGQITLSDTLANNAFWCGHLLRGYGPLFSQQPRTTIVTARAAVKKMKVVQCAENQAFILSEFAPPWIVSFAGAAMAIQPAGFASDPLVGYVTNVDGPWDDPLPGPSQTNNATGTLVGAFPNYTFNITSSNYTYNSDNSSQIGGDNGRLIRVWSQPPAWSSSTAYTVGGVVTYQGAFYRCQVANTGSQPGDLILSNGIYVPAWFPAVQVSAWAYGVITSAPKGGTHATVQMSNNIDTILAANGNVIDTWQLGLYWGPTLNDQIGGLQVGGNFPSCGAWSNGRLWLAGAENNRIDGSMTIGKTVNRLLPTFTQGGVTPGFLLPLFSPTDQYGNVWDDSAIAEYLNNSPMDSIISIEVDRLGLILGTVSGSSFLSSGAGGVPITPTTIDVVPASSCGFAQPNPVFPGLAHIFVERYGRVVYEMIYDAFSQRQVNRPINEMAQHLTISGVASMAYCETPLPLIWCGMQDGSLASCLYRRKSYFASEEPLYTGWSSHAIASLSQVNFVASTPYPAVNPRNIFQPDYGFGGEEAVNIADSFYYAPQFPQGDGAIQQTVVMTGLDAATGQGVLEIMSPRFADGQPLSTATCLDGWMSGGSIDNNGRSTGFTLTGTIGPTGLTFGGLRQWASQTVRAFLAGIDCGLVQVNQYGIAFVPFNATLTAALVEQYRLDRVNAAHIGSVGIPIGQPGNVPIYYLPGCFGQDYGSIGTMMRPQQQAQLHTQNGPGVGKRRRTHMVSAHVVYTSQLSFSIDGQTYQPYNFNRPPEDGGGATPYTGIIWDTINATWNFDNALSWQATGPYPCTVLNVGGFLDAEDR